MSDDPMDDFFVRLVEVPVQGELKYASHPSDVILKSYVAGKLPKEWRFSDELIRSLAQGKLADWNDAEVAVHVRTCEQCNARVQYLKHQKHAQHSISAKVLLALRAWMQKRRPRGEPAQRHYPFPDAEVLAFFAKAENRELLQAYGFSLFGKAVELEKLTLEEKRLLYAMMLDQLRGESKPEPKQ